MSATHTMFAGQSTAPPFHMCADRRHGANIQPEHNGAERADNAHADLPVPFAQVEKHLEQLSIMDKFKMMPKEVRQARLENLAARGAISLAYLPYCWEVYARPNQMLPKGNWINWIVQAGRGFGKTRVGSEAIRKWHWTLPITHIVAPTTGDIYKVILNGPAGLLTITSPKERPHFKTTDSTLYWPNGAKTLVFSAEEPERLRGPQCYAMWCDELAAWKYVQATWDNATFGNRLGDNPQTVITTTPRPIKLLKELIAMRGTIVTRGTTHDNAHNLAPKFLNEIVTKYQGTRTGRQELEGELLEDNPGALWTLDMIDTDRINDAEHFWTKVFPELARVVVAIDPAVSSNAESDETGIASVGRDKQAPPHFYVFDDRSCVERPEGWAKRAVAAYKQFNADRIVGEVNNGGEMVESTIRNVNPNVSYKAVRASRGKITRAEPVSALYEQHRVHHVGNFAQMEDQMCSYDPATADYSPDRMDAVVWGVTDLMEGFHGTLDYWDRQIQEQKKAAANVSVRMATSMQSEEEKADMGLYKVSTIKNLAKPDTSKLAGAQTQACPACGNVALARFAEGAWKCNNCGASGRDPWNDIPMKKSL